MSELLTADNVFPNLQLLWFSDGFFVTDVTNVTVVTIVALVSLVAVVSVVAASFFG